MFFTKFLINPIHSQIYTAERIIKNIIMYYLPKGLLVMKLPFWFPTNTVVLQDKVNVLVTSMAPTYVYEN